MSASLRPRGLQRSRLFAEQVTTSWTWWSDMAGSLSIFPSPSLLIHLWLVSGDDQSLGGFKVGNKVLALRVFISVLQAWKAENIRSLLGDLSFDWELGSKTAGGSWFETLLGGVIRIKLLFLRSLPAQKSLFSILYCNHYTNCGGVIRSPGEGNGNPLQYSCRGNPKDRGAWRAAVPGVAQSQTQLSAVCDQIVIKRG